MPPATHFPQQPGKRPPAAKKKEPSGKESPYDPTDHLRGGSHRHGKNENGRGAGPPLRRRGGVRGLHADLSGHGHRHRRPHSGGDGGHPPPHGGRGRSRRELVRGPVRIGGRYLCAGYPPPGPPPYSGGRHGTVSGVPDPRHGLCRRKRRRRDPAAPAAAAGAGGRRPAAGRAASHRPGQRRKAAPRRRKAHPPGAGGVV